MRKFLGLLFVTVFLAAGCSDSNSVEPVNNSEGGTLEKSYNVSEEVHAELQALKAATAKYHDIKRAREDGYVVDGPTIPNMGFHIINPTYMDATFELTKPEILVYTLHDNGRYELVAIEYAVPIPLSASAPEGFTGSDDVWVQVVPEPNIWAVHAWIWKYNPDGVFNGTNSMVP